MPSTQTKKIRTKPLSKSHINAIRNRWWYHENGIEFWKNSEIPPFFREEMYDLRKHLLSFGGFEVCMPTFEPDLDAILARGELWHKMPCKQAAGIPNNCHRNAATLWFNDPEKYTLCTGYALSNDGIWRCHSWLIDKASRRPHIIETTEKRVAYYGFQMSEQEAKAFYHHI